MSALGFIVPKKSENKHSRGDRNARVQFSFHAATKMNPVSVLRRDRWDFRTEDRVDRYFDK